VNWWKRLLRKDELERQLDSELRFHFDRQMDDLIRNGRHAGERAFSSAVWTK
jgi:hypothetical protein